MGFRRFNNLVGFRKDELVHNLMTCLNHRHCLQVFQVASDGEFLLLRKGTAASPTMAAPAIPPPAAAQKVSSSFFSENLAFVWVGFLHIGICNHFLYLEYALHPL